MALYSAIDLHSTYSVLAVIDQEDHLLRRRRLPNDLPTVLRELERKRPPATPSNHAAVHV